MFFSDNHILSTYHAHTSCPKIARHWIVSFYLFKKCVWIEWKWPKMKYGLCYFCIEPNFFSVHSHFVFKTLGFCFCFVLDCSLARQMTKTWHKTNKGNHIAFRLNSARNEQKTTVRTQQTNKQTIEKRAHTQKERQKAHPSLTSNPSTTKTCPIHLLHDSPKKTLYMRTFVWHGITLWPHSFLPVAISHCSSVTATAAYEFVVLIDNHSERK